VTDEQPPEPKIDTTVPHSARIWNYWLGGNDNYAVDRAAGDRYMAVNPGIVDTARASRAFIGRAVRYLVGEAGMRQLLDIGTGLPTVDNTHEIAQRVAPECRIVYVDNDPLVLAHARALLTSSPEGATDYLDADAREPETIVQAASKLLDFTKPIGLMFMGVLAHIPDYDQVRSIVTYMLATLPSGSYLAIYDGTNTNPASVQAQQQYRNTGAVPYVLRTPEQIASYFEGLELVEPGVVTITRWRPDGPVTMADRPAFGGVARKP
jgi:S-adenosyl methyltransferase